MTEKILIALDNSEGAWSAVEYVSQTFNQSPGVQVALLHILPSLPPGFWDHGHVVSSEAEKENLQRLIANWEKGQEQQVQGLMQKAHDRLKEAGIPPGAVTDRFKPKDYDVADDILDEAEADGFDNIVMGRRGLGRAKALLLGSVTQKVVQKARKSAVTIVSKLRPIKKILFPLDLEADYQAIIPLVQDLAGKVNAAIMLLYVIPPVTLFPTFYVNINIDSFVAEAKLSAGKQMADIIKDFFTEFKVETRIESGDPADRILEVSQEEGIDLIIMGTHGRQGLERAVLGSVASKVVQSALCTVVTKQP